MLFLWQEIFKKIISLLGDQLGKRLAEKQPDQQGALLHLFQQLTELSLLIERIDTAITKVTPQDWGVAEGAVRESLNDVAIVLSKIRADLLTLAPAFEIFAVEAQQMVTDLVGQEEDVVSYILSDRPINTEFRGPDDAWKQQLADVRRSAQQARNTLAQFIRDNFTYADIAK